MLSFTASIVAILILLVVSAWLRVKTPEYQLKLVAAKLDSYRSTVNPLSNAEIKLLQKLYKLVNISMDIPNVVHAYKAIDLLKLSYGYGLLRSNEYQHLSSVVITAIRIKQVEIAAIALGAFRPLIRNTPVKDLAMVIEHLTLIAALAARFKYKFIPDKVLEIIFDIIDSVNCEQDKRLLAAIFKCLRVIGTFALKRCDYQLFYELANRFKAWANIVQNRIAFEVEELFVVWLHLAVKNDDKTAMTAIIELGDDLCSCKSISVNGASIIIDEASKAAGTSSLSLRNKVPPLILEFILELAAKTGDLAVWRKAVRSVGQVAAIAVSRCDDVTEAFHIILPLFETGRSMLNDEITFGEYSEDDHRKRLFIIGQECILLAELKARQNMTSSAGEIISDIYEQWNNCYGKMGSPKSIKKFCQFLLLYWQRTRQKDARRAKLSNIRLTETILVSDRDRKRLGI